jgi:hypothetical protein
MEYDNLTKDFIDRYKILIDSSVMKDLQEYAKSDYWKYHAKQVNIELHSNNKITANGKSNKIKIYEICRMRRLVQLDSIFMRLEQINK